MVTTDFKATPHPDVVCTELHNGEAVLLHLGTKTYYTLNETGSRIWQLFSQGCSLKEVSQGIEAEFDVIHDRAQQCVIDLANQLVAEDLVHAPTE